MSPLSREECLLNIDQMLIKFFASLQFWLSADIAEHVEEDAEVFSIRTMHGVAGADDRGLSRAIVFEVRLFMRDGVRFGMAFNTLADGLLITVVQEDELIGI